MAREAIKGMDHRIIGYIETSANGRQKALGKDYRTLGYYEPRTDKTQDANYKVIASGNILTGLIHNQR